jgi:hypothetical protein
MRVKCANCGMIYDINPTPCDFQSEHERLACASCPSCKSNAKDELGHERRWRAQSYED